MHWNIIILITVSIKWWKLQVLVKLIFHISLGLVFYLVLIKHVLETMTLSSWETLSFMLTLVFGSSCDLPSSLISSQPTKMMHAMCSSRQNEIQRGSKENQAMESVFSHAYICKVYMKVTADARTEMTWSTANKQNLLAELFNRKIFQFHNKTLEHTISALLWFAYFLRIKSQWWFWTVAAFCGYRS